VAQDVITQAEYERFSTPCPTGGTLLFHLWPGNKVQWVCVAVPARQLPAEELFKAASLSFDIGGAGRFLAVLGIPERPDLEIGQMGLDVFRGGAEAPRPVVVFREPRHLGEGEFRCPKGLGAVTCRGPQRDQKPLRCLLDGWAG